MAQLTPNQAKFWRSGFNHCEANGLADGTVILRFSYNGDPKVYVVHLKDWGLATEAVISEQTLSTGVDPVIAQRIIDATAADIKPQPG